MISIIIPTLNSEETLNECLNSIKSNKTKYDYEIIVVDGGSSDKTISISERYADKIFIKKNAGTGRQRNFGVEKAKGEIICFTDSDCVVPKNWIDSLVKHLIEKNRDDKRIVGVGGPNVPLLINPSFMERCISIAMRSPLIAFKARNIAVDMESHEVLHNPPMNSAYFKWVLKKVGGFGMESIYGEDVELDAKIIDEGYKLVYIPDVVVQHKHKASFNKFVVQMLNFGKARIRVGRKYKRFLEIHHYGPIFLCLFTFTPLFFIPLSLASINAIYETIRARNILLFLPIMILTLTFYVSYGLGEIIQIVKEIRK